MFKPNISTQVSSPAGFPTCLLFCSTLSLEKGPLLKHRYCFKRTSTWTSNKLWGSKPCFHGFTSCFTFVVVGMNVRIVLVGVLISNHILHEFSHSLCAVEFPKSDWGKWLECRAKGSTGDAITALMALAPRTALLLQGRREREVDAKLLLQGDLVKAWGFPNSWGAQFHHSKRENHH